MRQRLTIITTFVVIIGLLVMLNSATHLKQEKVQDYELIPNRSTYHNGPTGLRALHDFLSESGYKIIRWRETPKKLLGQSGKLVTTFVVVGQTQIPFSEDDGNSLHDWVAGGGRLVIIDRKLNDLAPSSQGWSISASALELPNNEIDPASASKMTEGVTALEPVQPTILTSSVQSVMPSRFAARLSIVPPAEKEKAGGIGPGPVIRGVGIVSRQEEVPEPPPPPARSIPSSPVPIVHIADKS